MTISWTSLFGGAPPRLEFDDASAVGDGISVYTLFQPTVNGVIRGLRRYRAASAPSYDIASLWSYNTDAAPGVLLASGSAWAGSGGPIGNPGWDYVPVNIPVTAGTKYYVGNTADRFVTATTSSPFLTSSVTSPDGLLVAPRSDLVTPQANGRFAFGNGSTITYPNAGATNCHYQDVLFEVQECPDCPVCPECPPGDGFTINLTSPNFVAIVTGLAGCVVGALDQTPAGAPCRQCVLLPTQQIPWDNCGPCAEGCNGQVAFAIREVYGSKSFPQPLTGETWRKCAVHYSIARVVVSVTRCVPTMDERGNPPSCASELAAAITLENDRTAVRQAIADCLCAASAPTLSPRYLSEWSISPSVTVGELGGCAGVETEFLIGVQVACQCGS